MGPYDKAEEPNGEYGSYYSYVAEWFFFASVVCYYMGDDAESWKNEDIDFGVSKESEEMLVEDGVASSGGVKECSVQVAVCEKYCNTGSEYWK